MSYRRRERKRHKPRDKNVHIVGTRYMMAGFRYDLEFKNHKPTVYAGRITKRADDPESSRFAALIDDREVPALSQ